MRQSKEVGDLDLHAYLLLPIKEGVFSVDQPTDRPTSSRGSLEHYADRAIIGHMATLANHTQMLLISFFAMRHAIRH